MATAILVDGGFYRKRAAAIWGQKTAKERADELIDYCRCHLAHKRLAGQIILISGDSDFVPAAKMARREGVDFILDPMGGRVSDDLMEHIDGLSSHWRDMKSGKRHVGAKSQRPAP